MNDQDVCFASAVELAEQIRNRQISCVEVVSAHLRQIEQTNHHVNAIVTLAGDAAIATAELADQAVARGAPLGPLHGVPVLYKDLTPTKGMRTTFGSPIYADHIPDHDALIVERLRAAGAISLGKSNTPEFGAGSQTFNPVFGATLNPYDLAKTCGGSSGGAAVALACGMTPLAEGSDMGGSLRNPASFCNVVGFRPSPGRVPVWPKDEGWLPIPVQGPMARTVKDVALMLSAIAGPDPRDPIAIAEPGETFRRSLGRDFQDVRIAWSRNLGHLPVDPAVTSTLDQQRTTFESLGCRVEEDEPNGFEVADDIFKVWRAWLMEMKYAGLLRRRRADLKDTVVWNIEQGQTLTGPEIGRIERLHMELFHRMRKFMDRYEFLVLPVSQVPPFDVELPYVTSIHNQPMETYIDWMKSCYYITVTGHPAISVPAGFTSEGLPIGIQIVGRHQHDFEVMQLAYAFEQATAFGNLRPPLLDRLQ